MKIARVQRGDRRCWALVEGAVVEPIDGEPFGRWKKTAEQWSLADVCLLPPVEPRQIVAIGLNYRDHAREGGKAVPEAPLVFIKTPNTVIGPDEAIVLPDMASAEVDYEAELVVVIGKRARNVSVAEARDVVLGYTCGNDVSARDCQMRLDKQWARAKCFDTFAPLGPWIETELDPGRCDIRSTLNEEVMQESNTAEMVFSCDELVSYVSHCMTLYPGSVIFTGTPAGVGWTREPAVFLRPGDVITVEIEGIGCLTNRVEAEASGL